MPVMAMHAGKARRFLMQRPPIDVVLYAKRSGRKLPCVKRPSHSATDTFAVGMITPSRAIPVFTVAEPALAHRSPSTRPTAGRDRTRADSLGDREPALLLFHLDLLRDPDGVLCVGLRYRAAIHGLVLQRTHGCAEVEDMRRLGLLGSV